MSNKFKSIYFGKGEEVVGRSREIEAYYAAISNFPVLTDDEEVKLVEKMQAGDESAKEKLINCNLRGVVSIVRKCYANYGGCLSVMDLISAGNIGLIKAIEKYDLTYGVRLLSFAVNQIRAAVTYEIKRKSRIVTDYRGQNPNEHTSLDEPMADDTDTTLGDVMCVSVDKESCANESLLTDLMRVINNVLNETEGKVICFVFGIGIQPKSQWEIANELQKTEERIRQIKETAIAKLKNNEKALGLLTKYCC